ncbi:MAG: hypothetical protein AB1792_10830 [Candidatus Zixiibacteriota bacterium]
MNEYVRWVTANPVLSAAVQFAILGMIGEIVSHSLLQRRVGLPCHRWRIAAKVVGWAVLGVFVKYGFVGMKGFTRALIDHRLLPESMGTGIGWAFAVSAIMNILFGPHVMIVHRLTDNLIMGRRDFRGMAGALRTLMWFWIPAHTLTFLAPTEFQIGLAAAWSVVLGLIMGFSRRPEHRRSQVVV